MKQITKNNLVTPDQKYIEEYWEKRDPDGANQLTGHALEMVASALQKMEDMTSNIRDIYMDMVATPYAMNPDAATSGVQRKNELANQLFDQTNLLHGYNIEYLDNVLRLTIPMALPRRNKTATNEFKENLHILLNQFCNEDSERYTFIREQLSDDWVVVIQHVYTRPELMRDNDNVNIKHVIDEICRTFYTSDRGDRCIIVQCTAKQFEKKAVTHVYAMKSNIFIEWYQNNVI